VDHCQHCGTSLDYLGGGGCGGNGDLYGCPDCDSLIVLGTSGAIRGGSSPLPGT